MKLVRFGVSLPQDLIKRFDALITKKNYPNRSEAIRDLIRNALVEEAIQHDQEVVGVLSIVYDHHKRELSDKLTLIQHNHYSLIISVMHVHLDHVNCLEVILLRGKAVEIKNFADTIIAVKGVKHGRLHLTSTGENLI